MAGATAESTKLNLIHFQMFGSAEVNLVFDLIQG